MPPSSPSAPANRQDWQTLKSLLPYLWAYKWRVILALSLLVLAKFANVGVPLVLKDIVDALDASQHPLAVPLALVLAYGGLRLASAILGEARDAVFAKVTQGAIRRVALQVFEHLHRLSLRFHLERQTGGVNRDIDRGTKGIAFLLNFTLFNILPTLVEIVLVALVLLQKYDWYYAAITFGTIAVYIAFTLGVTEWRMGWRKAMNELDSSANSKAVDSLLNYETVKYFNNERWEARRYDDSLAQWEAVAIKSQVSLNFLNAGQAAIIAVGVTALVWLAAADVVAGKMSLGDLVLVNAFLLQLYGPLNFLGFVYREIKHALADMEKMFALMGRNTEITDAPDARALATQAAEVRFDNVVFGYDAERQILFGVDFTIPAGHTLAVVGASGAGKSTLSRLLYRFYDVSDGGILINGQDIRGLQQHTLREHIGIVPQDTVLFNDTIYYNIAYGRPEATREDIIEAARSAHIHDFIAALPQGYDTVVGERGLKLSGGEKQRVAIARTILKNPPILIFDEATSALDSKTEKAIQAELKAIAANRTTLIIAHRLSTVVDADEILVMEGGRVVERGTHRALLDANGVYARMWALQASEEAG
ncbi:ABCB family ABC transporter ATP-binding protein/permease [Chitinilyticum litopenaei]|uniref:ABCB family ABC transporter ATP-binding protein/permease n=1 Tax=Chitinilyticum litopenaei TaxID=1121276 RepID=UPI00042332F0|nr:ABC transporter ATP-binding protein/permease [Chitinilyticum litopenaei]